MAGMTERRLVDQVVVRASRTRQSRGCDAGYTSVSVERANACSGTQSGPGPPTQELSQHRTNSSIVSSSTEQVLHVVKGTALDSDMGRAGGRLVGSGSR